MSRSLQGGRLALAMALAASALPLAPALAETAPTPTAPSGYTLTLLNPATDHVYASALGLNDAGDVVGISRPTTKAQPQLTVVWHAGEQTPHTITQLDGSKFSRGFDIAGDGTVAGEAFNSGGNSVPVSGTTALATLPTPNTTGLGVAVDIAENGTIIANAADGTNRIAYTITGGKMTPLAKPTVAGATISGVRASSISSDGSTVAGVTLASVPHGDHSHDEKLLTIWRNGSATVHDTEQAVTPLGVNDNGMVVGSVRSTHSMAVRFADGQLTQLTSPQLADFPHTRAQAVNASGVIVGDATAYESNPSFGGRALAWFGDQVVDLNTLTQLPEGVTLLSASDVNASGQIVGVADTPNGKVGFLLTPVPAEEPTPEPTPEPSTEPTAPVEPSAPAEEPSTTPEPSATPEPSREASAPETSQTPSTGQPLPKTGV